MILFYKTMQYDANYFNLKELPALFFCFSIGQKWNVMHKYFRLNIAVITNQYSSFSNYFKQLFSYKSKLENLKNLIRHLSIASISCFTVFSVLSILSVCIYFFILVERVGKTKNCKSNLGINVFKAFRSCFPINNFSF